MENGDGGDRGTYLQVPTSNIRPPRVRRKPIYTYGIVTVRFIEQRPSRDREISSVESLFFAGLSSWFILLLFILRAALFRCFSIGWEILYGSACSMPIHIDMLYA